MKKILISLLSVKEICLIAEVIMKVGAAVFDKYELLQIVRNRMSATLPTAQSSISFDSGSKYTEILKLLDQERDEQYLGFNVYLKSMLKIGTEKQKEAAKMILRIYSVFGLDLTDLPYADESISMRSFLEMLSEPKVVKAIKTVNAEIYVQNIQSSEQAFEAKMNERNANEQSDYSYEEVKRAKQKLYYDMQFVLDAFDRLLDQAPDEELKKIAGTINEYIADTMANARARKTRKLNSKTEVEENTEE